MLFSALHKTNNSKHLFVFSNVLSAYVLWLMRDAYVPIPLSLPSSASS